MCKNLSNELDELLDSCGEISDTAISSLSKTDVLKSIEESEQKLEDEFQEIDRIKTESLRAAINEEIFL